MRRSPNHYLIAALIVAVSLIVCLATVRACTDESEVTASARLDSVESGAPLRPPTTATPATEPPTTEAPVVVTEAPVPDSLLTPEPTRAVPTQSATTETQPEGNSGAEGGYVASWFATGPDGDYVALGYGSAFSSGDTLRVCHSGACVDVVANDTCVGCGPGKLDLSNQAFGAIASLSAGIIDVTVARVG